jgi:arylsulfatase A-like enzyme
MAFRMQTHADEAFDLSAESEQTHQLYGTEPGKESFANNCLLARRLAERGVRFIQLFHWGWDSHGASAAEALNEGFKDRCREVDQPMTALIKDLRQRGLLEDTLIIWSGEFGRTPMRENRGGVEMKFVGRDHNPGAFTIWLAGGGTRPGMCHGATDDIGYEAVVDPVSPHDLHATLLHLLGIDHKRLTYPFQGLEQRLSNVTKPSRVISEIMA